MIVPDLVKAVTAGQKKAMVEIKGKGFMNKRINELAEQAGFYVSANGAEILIPDPHTEDITGVLEKFAELIVRECIDCLKPLSRNHSMVGAAQDTIKEHFGVEQ